MHNSSFLHFIGCQNKRLCPNFIDSGPLYLFYTPSFVPIFSFKRRSSSNKPRTYSKLISLITKVKSSTTHLDCIYRSTNDYVSIYVKCEINIMFI